MPSSTEKAVDFLFDAAVQAAPWSVGLDLLASAFNAEGSFIITDDPVGVERGIPLGSKLDGLFEAFVAGGWHQNDLRAARAWPLISTGKRVFLEHDLSTETERLTQPYYQDFFWKLGLPWFAGVGCAIKGRRWALCFLRGTGQQPYDGHDTRPLGALSPHLRRIVTIANEFSASVQRSTLSLLEHSSEALLALDFHGRVEWASPPAINTLESVVSFRNGRLHARDSGANAQLQSVIRTAITAKTPALQPENGVVLLTNEGIPAVLVEIIALPRSGTDVFSQAAALMFVKDLVHRRPAPVEKLVRLLGLTNREASVAAAVGSGMSLRDTATTLGLSYETARTHLARIFQKLSINRQVELMLIIEKL
ncbi:helix-turn-helix transcriptional regulator [Devosia sp. A369]